uniref:Uncharacterized protein n=1 Tax=Cacopsylla melanoneura TaxID=428564 RepID=A0A8D8R467_9HEMI
MTPYFVFISLGAPSLSVMYSVFSNEICNPAFSALSFRLLINFMASVMSSENIARSSAKAKQSTSKSLFLPILIFLMPHFRFFSLHFLITFSSTQLNSTQEIPSPCLKPVLILNGFDRMPANLTFDCVFVRVCLIRAVVLPSTPNSSSVLNSVSRSIES